MSVMRGWAPARLPPHLTEEPSSERRPTAAKLFTKAQLPADYDRQLKQIYHFHPTDSFFPGFIEEMRARPDVQRPAVYSCHPLRRL